MKVHLVDGTYELFRYHFAPPSHVTAEGREVAATRGVVGSLLELLEDGATHVGVATDHVIESFRNDLWPGYKTGAGMRPGAARRSSRCSRRPSRPPASRFGRWSSSRPTTRSARRPRVAAADRRVEQVLICTPDKDLAQCVRRRPRRAVRSPQGRRLRRGRRRREVRRPADVDPRLPGPRG